MKKYIILLIVPLLFFSTGCEEDDNGNNITPSLLVGHWGYISETSTTNKTYDYDGDLFENEQTTTWLSNYPSIDDSVKVMLYLTFFDNFQMNQSSYLLNSNDQVLNVEESILIDYSLEGNVISMPNFFPDVSGDGFINQLTETNLEIQWEWNSVGIEGVVSLDSEMNPITTDVEYSQNTVTVISLYKVSELPE